MRRESVKAVAALVMLFTGVFIAKFSYGRRITIIYTVMGVSAVIEIMFILDLWYLQCATRQQSQESHC